jgi:hypothetical protein
VGWTKRRKVSAYLVMFRKSVVVENCKHERLVKSLAVRNLNGKPKESEMDTFYSGMQFVFLPNIGNLLCPHLNTILDLFGQNTNSFLLFGAANMWLTIKGKCISLYYLKPRCTRCTVQRHSTRNQPCLNKKCSDQPRPALTHHKYQSHENSKDIIMLQVIINIKAGCEQRR